CRSAQESRLARTKGAIHRSRAGPGSSRGLAKGGAALGASWITPRRVGRRFGHDRVAWLSTNARFADKVRPCRFRRKTFEEDLLLSPESCHGAVTAPRLHYWRRCARFAI